MGRPVIPEWAGPELLYVDPTQAVKSFGYARVGPQTPATYGYLQSAIERAADADGEAAAVQRPFRDEASASAEVKRLAAAEGADEVGITHLDARHVYKGAEVPHRYVVMIALAMDYEELKQCPTAVSSAEILRTYAECGRIASAVAEMIRARGYPARTHTLRFEQINMLPHAVAAGLGEVGKHGSLINRRLGCSFRLAAVTTDLPLGVDTPRSEGVEDFCMSCHMCVNYCPGDAISDEKAEVRGTERWIVDTEACAPYWGTYYACGMCLVVCPFNSIGFGGRHRESLVQTVKAIDLPRWRAELAAGLQEPWSLVERPSEFPEGWRMEVRGKGEGAVTFRGVPPDGVARAVEGRG